MINFFTVATGTLQLIYATIRLNYLYFIVGLTILMINNSSLKITLSNLIQGRKPKRYSVMPKGYQGNDR